MKQLFLLFFALVLSAVTATAQTARVQIIHNAPDPAVDVYVNGTLALDDFAFRTATPFLTLPAGVNLSIAVAPSTSVSVAEAIATFDATFESGETYVVAASGIVGDLTTPFTLFVNDLGQESSTDTEKVDISILHGAPNAPAVDVDAVFVANNVIENLPYGSFTTYLGLTPDVYDFAVRATGSSTVVASYRADLSGLKGAAATVFASGLLGGTPAFGLYAALADGTVIALPITPTAQVQIIHNSPEPTVDVYAGNTLLLNDFAYRTATPYVTVPADRGFAVGVAPSSSASVNDAIYTQQVNFAAGNAYTVAASGIVGDPTTPFTLLANAARTVSSDTNLVEINVLHGATNAPAVDVDAVFVANNVVANLAYGNFSAYLGIGPDVYDFAVRAAGAAPVVASYRADLSGLKGATATVFASGLLGGTPAFGLYAALADGTVIALPITPTAQVQIIHNSPEPTVDVYAGNTLLLNDFVYRTATPYVTVPADRGFAVGVAPSSSASVNDAIYTQQVNFAAGNAYTVAASGIVGSPTTPFTLLANAARTVSSDTNLVEINVLHGATNAPAVDVDAVFVANNVVANLAYGNFSAYLGIGPDKYDFAVRAAGTAPVVASYRADLSGLKGATAIVFASGLLGGTPAFGLYAALADGTVIALPITPTAKVQIVHNSPSPTVDVYAGNTLLIKDFIYRNATPYVTVPADRLFTVGVAVAGSSSANDAIYTQQVGFDANKAYSVFASGVVGDLATPFTLLATEAKQVADNPTLVDLNVLHGSTNAPAVDVDALFVANNLVSNLSYSEFSGYFSVPPAVYDLAIRPAGAPDVVATFRADISGLDGQSATVFASGLLGGTPAFGLFAVLANGTVLELPLTPTARVQVIHNSPNPTVDVYAGNSLLINDFGFRTATPFITVPADVDIAFGIAPSGSADVNDAIYTQSVNFAAGKTYSVFASGIVGDPTAPFTLLADEAREAAIDPSKVEFATLHGAPFAPAVDVAVVGVGDIITNLVYGEFAPYIAVDPANYQVQVKVAGTSTVVATYQVDLSSLGGGAARLFASGLLTGSPAFGLFAALPDGTVVEFPGVQVQTFARLQVIHNSPNPTVDVYVNNDKLIDDFVFRTATPFITVPAGTVLNVGVALANSQSVNDVLVNFPVTLEADKTYIATASGIVGSPTTPFTLILNNAAQESAGSPTKVDVAVLHGATNAPAVDVDAVFVADNIVNNLSYGQFTPYLSLDPGVYDLAVRPSGTSVVVASYRADLSGLAGGAAYVFASGLIGGNPGFGLFAALPSGVVIELPTTPTTKVQIIHNSPEPTVDIYAGNALIIKDFAFRTATPFIDIPADRGFAVGVAVAGSNSVNDVIASFPVNFESGKNYTVFASGVVGNIDTPFTLWADDNAQLSAAPGFTAVSIVHGSPDAPAVDVAERQAGILAANLTYGDITPYLNLASDVYFIDIKLPGTEQIVGTYLADLSGLSGAAIRVFASGFLGGAPGFGLFAALADGTVVELPYTPVARLQIIHNSPDPVVDVYVEDTQLIDDFEFRTATPFFYVPAESLLNVGVAPATSQSVNDVIANFPVTFENGKTYVVVASGLVGGSPAFTLIVNDMGQERAVDPTKLELAILHGAPDAPAVNINDYFDGTPLLTDLQYGDFTPYVPFDADVLLLDVAATANPTQSLGIWGGDFTDTEGLAGVVFASGLLNGDPGFDLWVALPDGFTFPLPSFSQVQVIHNSPSPTVDVYLDEDQILDNFEYHNATGMGLLPAGVSFDLSVAPENSVSVNDAIYTLPVAGLERGKNYVIMAAGVVGNATTPFQLYVNDKGRVRAQTPTNVDLALFHGSPDAPAVDVQLPGGPVLFNDVSFGSFVDYLSVPAGPYVVQITPANDNNTIVKSYLADLSGAAGRAGTVYASGYLNGQPSFETWVAFSDGVTFPLPEFVNTNELAGKLAEFRLAPNPAVDEIMVQFNLNQTEALRYAVRDNVGKLMSEGDMGTVAPGDFAQKIRVDNLPAGMYQLEIRSDAGIQTRKFVVQK